MEVQRSPSPRGTRHAFSPIVAVIVAGALAAVLGGAAPGARLSVAHAQAAPGDPVAGARVFRSAGCSSCHTLSAAGATGTVGPNLDSLKPTFEQVVAQVNAGGGAMPPFAGVLTAAQIADVAAYVSQSTGGSPPSAPAPAAAGGPSGAPAPGGAPGATTAPAGATAGTRTLSLRVVRDRRMRLSAREVVAGSTAIALRNAGRQTHYVALLRTDRPLRALRVRGGWLRERGQLAKVTLRPGGRGRFSTLDLKPGRYVLTCRLTSHVRRGLRTALRVVAAPTSIAPMVPGLGTATAAPAPPSTPPPAVAPEVKLDGAGLFKVNCGGCHTLAAAGTTGTVGPSLDDKHPDYGKVVEKVNEGDAPMPSFRGRLTPEQIADIARFVSDAVGRGGS
jgi:mono/diheme cytochrome c family protein